MTTDSQHLELSVRAHKLLPATVIGIVAVVAFTVVFWSGNALAAFALLMISFVIDFFIAALAPDSQLSSELAWCEVAKASLIFAYIWMCLRGTSASIVGWLLSGVSLVAALSVTVAIFLLAVSAVRESRPAPATSLEELRNDRVLALLAMVLAFLHITYFLSFALAFSDRFAERGLWAFDFTPPKAVGAPAREPTTRHVTTTAGKPWCTGSRQDKVRRFFFVQSAATMACTKAACDRADAEPALQTLICESGVPGRLGAFKNLALAACGRTADANQIRAAAWNARELYELRNVFRNLAASSADGSYQVEVRGHANDAKLSNGATAAYGSNLEISKQRAEQVEFLLQAEFRSAIAGMDEPSIRWLAYGVSNEDSFLDDKPDPDAENLDQKLSVEVYVQQVAVPFTDGKLRQTQAEVTNVTRMLASSATPRKLDLLDYLYFTIYTITTTGYGDIVPISSWAKFIVSIANLIELLFLVVLVNVIANVRPAIAAVGDRDANRS